MIAAMCAIQNAAFLLMLTPFNFGVARLRQLQRHDKSGVHGALTKKRFFDKAMGANGDPEKVAMDKYLDNIVEQDHRAIKRVTKPMLNLKSFRCAGCVLARTHTHDPQGPARDRWRRCDVVR